MSWMDITRSIRSVVRASGTGGGRIAELRTGGSDTRKTSLFLLALLLLAGCQPTLQSVTQPAAGLQGNPDNTARLSFFLNLKESNGPAIRMGLAALEVLADDAWLPVTTTPLQLDSETIGSAQRFLGARAVPPGRYQRFRLRVAEGSVRRDDGGIESVPVDPSLVELELPTPLQLDKDDSECLFLSWDLQGSLERADTFRPALAVFAPVRQLLVDLVYAACPDINTVFVIRSDKNWVVDSFGVKGEPTYMALAPGPSAQRLYVLASREPTIKVVDLVSQRIVESFRIPLVSVPAFMTLSPDGRWVYVLDDRDSYLSRLDLASGNLVKRVRLGYRPRYAVYLTGRSLLAVSSALSQTVSFHDPASLSEVGRVNTGTAPDGLLASDNQLYIAESGANTVSIFDLGSNMMQSRLAVGLRPRRILDNGNQIYVSNYDSGSLSVIFRGQLGAGREIPGLGRPLEMIFNQTNRRIYVGDESRAGLAIIDSTTNRLSGYVTLGARPLGLAVIQ